MKKLFTTVLFAAGLLLASQVQAQTVKKIGHSIGHAATNVGHKTSELASKGAAVVADKRYEGKVAPNGEAVYIDKHSRYFYVDKKGHHVYIAKSRLRNKH
ncbi:hypothetical protein C8P68_105155 [Mucilaginibacter yixingensis]|uniref:Uncharacterized protein n=1 Tax=Mucilaginibacter yixingensis TaxID=1295612 RepID=A0A2T5J867_9SPHI|nr:hypothetical protein [Mucilaginibacter yixingensis]PTQ95650.1 hypothetical protein C8P68_105155 [Mucilaginibacter yixingensis]